MVRTKGVSNKALSKQVRDVTKKPVGDNKVKGIDRKRLIPTGSTMLNLALSDTPSGGLMMGKIVNIIGDSHAGKTMLVKNLLASICTRTKFDDYELIYDDSEQADEFNDAKMFGVAMAKRVRPPTKDGASLDVRKFQNNILNTIADGKPFIYVQDSFDSLATDEEMEKADKRRKGKEVAGMMGMQKAKIAHEIMRLIKAKLKETNSLLIIISQSRMDTGSSFIKNKYRSGGDALDFYSSYVLWLALGSQIYANLSHHKDNKGGKGKRVIGVHTKIKISKNKITGKRRNSSFPIYYDYGIDDIASCIDFMVDEAGWQKKGGTIQADNLGIEGVKKSLIQQIEDGGLEKRMQIAVGKRWNEIEDEIRTKRKPRYK